MKRGFTLIELVMVIVILGILAATALPRFIDLSTKAKENAAKASLGGIRAAIAIKYASNAVLATAAWPTTIDESLFADGKIPGNPYSASSALASTVEVGTATTPPGGVNGWYYNNDNTPGATHGGRVWMNDADTAHYSW